jgi:hypothetical protein
VAVPGRPFTVKWLAERGDCSESHIRSLIARGGTLIENLDDFSSV